MSPALPCLALWRFSRCCKRFGSCSRARLRMGKCPNFGIRTTQLKDAAGRSPSEKKSAWEWPGAPCRLPRRGGPPRLRIEGYALRFRVTRKTAARWKRNCARSSKRTHPDGCRTETGTDPGAVRRVDPRRLGAALPRRAGTVQDACCLTLAAGGHSRPDWRPQAGSPDGTRYLRGRFRLFSA